MVKHRRIQSVINAVWWLDLDRKRLGIACWPLRQPWLIRRRQGITLLELLIVLVVVAVILFIALPTGRLSEEERAIAVTKKQLMYLYSQEKAYFKLKGTYGTLPQLAGDPEFGARFDQRFALEESLVEGVVFKVRNVTNATFFIEATLPDGSRYMIDQQGKVKPLQ